MKAKPKARKWWAVLDKNGWLRVGRKTKAEAETSRKGWDLSGRGPFKVIRVEEVRRGGRKL